jgi:hypothetical protein
MHSGHLSGWPFAFLGLGIEHFWGSWAKENSRAISATAVQVHHVGS